MNKEQRERRLRYRDDWKNSANFHGLSYQAWLEEQLERQINEARFMNRVLFHTKDRIEAFKQYIYDFETGMRTVEKCARGTIGIATSIPALKKEDDGEAIALAITSLYRLLGSAKQSVLQVSDAEKEAARIHNESISKKVESWFSE